MDTDREKGRGPGAEVGGAKIDRVVYARGMHVYMARVLENGKIEQPALLSKEAIGRVAPGEAVKVLKKGMSRVQMASVIKAFEDDRESSFVMKDETY